MKKLLIVLVLGIAAVANAADWKSQSFLVASQTVYSNATFAYTDYTPATNSYGIVTNINNFQDVVVSADALGRASDNFEVIVQVPAAGATATNTYTVNIGKLATAADGTDIVNTVFSFSFLATGATALTVQTNIPSTALVGTKKLRLVSIVGATAATATTTNRITTLSLNGWLQ